MNTQIKSFLAGALPVAALIGFALVVTQSGLLDRLRQVPPVEELTFERVTLESQNIKLDIVNGGPDPVTVAQVTVDDAFWNFTITPSGTIPRLGRATVEIPYPWVQEEAHEVTLLSSTGATFAHEIPVAMATPEPGGLFLGVFTLIGLYVGVIPVAIGLLWLPFLRGLSRRWTHFALALTAGLLIFLGVDAFEEALEAGAQVAGAYQGTAVVLIGIVGTVLFLQTLAGRSLRGEGAARRRALAFLVAFGIGIHNLGEGLAIGAAYALGEATLTAFLVVGFMLHNTTEGLAIVAPVAKDRPSLAMLIKLGLLAGLPTVFGAWLGGLAYSPLWATLFLSVGVGAILQVVYALYKTVARDAERPVWTPLTALGLMAGLLVMYGTGLFVAL